MYYGNSDGAMNVGDQGLHKDQKQTVILELQPNGAGTRLLIASL